MRKILLTLISLLIPVFTFSQTYSYKVNPHTGKFDIIGYNVSFDTTNHRISFSTSVYSPAFYGDGSNLTGVVATSTQAADAECRVSTGVINADLQSYKTTVLNSTTSIISIHNSSMTNIENRLNNLMPLTSGYNIERDYALKADVQRDTSTLVTTSSFNDYKTLVYTATNTLVQTDTFNTYKTTVLNSTNSIILIIQSTMALAGLRLDELELIKYSTGSISAIFGSSITTAGNLTGLQVIGRCPYNCTIKGAYIGSDVSGSAVVNVYAGVNNASYSSIVASAKPTLTTAVYSADTTLTGWTVDIARGTWVKFVVESATTVKQVFIQLEVWRR